MRIPAKWILLTTFAYALFCLPVYGDSVSLPAHGRSEGTSFTLDCGDGKVLIGLKGKTGMFLGKLQGICRQFSSDGKWIGSTTYTSTSGGAGGIYPIVPQSFSITCPKDTAVRGLSGTFTGLITKLTLNCFAQGTLVSGYGISRSIEATVHSGDRTSWNEDRCGDAKPGRGLHGRYKTAGLASAGLICHAGTTPNLMVLAAPDEPGAVNLVGPNGPSTTAITPFVQFRWIDRSNYESGFRIDVLNTNENGRPNPVEATINRPTSAGIGSLQAVNVTDLPGGLYFLRVCSRFSASDGGDLCSYTLPQFRIALASNCNPTISSVTRLGSGTARVVWTHSCANPTNFIIRVRSGNNPIGTVASTLNGTARDETFNFVAATSSAVQVCAVFPGQAQTAFCSAERPFQAN